MQRTSLLIVASMGAMLIAVLVWNAIQQRANAPQYIRVDPSESGRTSASAAFELYTLEEVARLAEMGDFRRFPGMVNSGDIFNLEDGTPVHVIDRSGYYSRVEIQGGAYAGRRAWVPSYLIGP